LGLDAQRKAVLDYLNGGSWELVQEFVEIESGKHSDWTELAKALAACRKHKAKLVIAKLDRLSRNHEREMISERSKAALAAARARGNVLGNPRLADAAQRGREAGAANARRFAANVLPIIEEIERSGVTSHNAIAAKLNERNVKTARGGRWTHVQVGAVLRPFGA
jgi:DNA invertase Pin-like site-specific DNA recombinase